MTEVFCLCYNILNKMERDFDNCKNFYYIAYIYNQERNHLFESCI